MRRKHAGIYSFIRNIKGIEREKPWNFIAFIVLLIIFAKYNNTKFCLT